MAHVAKWWQVYLFDNPLRRLIHDPKVIFGPYVEPGMIVLDVGCGAGSNALGLARLVGEGGRVIAVDVQQQLLNIVERRARRAGLAERIETRLCEADSIGVDTQVDFANAFWMAHEAPDPHRLMRDVYALLPAGGMFLLVEPPMHVSAEQFAGLVATAQEVGFRVHDRPKIRFGRAAVLVRHSPERSA